MKPIHVSNEVVETSLKKSLKPSEKHFAIINAHSVFKKRKTPVSALYIIL